MMTSRTSRFACLLISTALLLSACDTTPTVSQPTPASELPAPAPEPAPEPATVEAAPEAAPETPAEPPQPVEIAEPQPAPQPVVCEPPQPAKPAKPARPDSVLPILGGLEYVTIEPPGLRLKARLDTGTLSSALDARNVREFERDGKTWVRFLLVDRNTQDSTEITRPVLRTAAIKGSDTPRYVVSLHTRLGNIEQFVEFLLYDRSNSRYPVLLGRTFLRDQALVDAARVYTVK